MKYFLLDGTNLTLDNSIGIIKNNIKLKLSVNAVNKIKKSRALINKWIENDRVIYGITTGFGEFKDVRISKKDVSKLQKNLILSHSAGVGDYIPLDIAKLMLLFRINSLAKGYSGVRPELMNYLIAFFNSGIVPLVPSQGSVGSSGDLAPLSHLVLCMLGKGKCFYNNRIHEARIALKSAGMHNLSLEAKEGLALTNGTQMMSAFLAMSLFEACRLSKLADVSSAFSVEALKATEKAFADELQKARPHKGQIKTAANLRRLLKNSEIMKSHRDCPKVQDPYSTRCIPQVHGAVKDVVNFCKGILETEINSATDNPLIFPDSEMHIEGGNFHGQPLAFASDFLAVAVSELGNISERRISRLVDGSLSGLPRFLTPKGGLNSGLMIAQYTAASLVSENKILCHPASVDSIPTSANQEDHNSMGSIAARKCLNVIENVKKIIAIEFLCASQGLEFHKPLRPSLSVNAGYKLIRKKVLCIVEDTVVCDEIEKISEVVYDDKFIGNIESVSGTLLV